VKKKKKGGRKGLRGLVTKLLQFEITNLELHSPPLRPTTDSCQPSFRTSVAALELLLIALLLSVALSLCSVLRLSRFNIRHGFSKSRHMSTSAGWTMKRELSRDTLGVGSGARCRPFLVRLLALFCPSFQENLQFPSSLLSRGPIVKPPRHAFNRARYPSMAETSPYDR